MRRTRRAALPSRCNHAWGVGRGVRTLRGAWRVVSWARARSIPRPKQVIIGDGDESEDVVIKVGPVRSGIIGIVVSFLFLFLFLFL